ncbi:hypothetical protein ACRN9F_02250 [Shewanella oncorhynchi]|uniref:hypothetical protein n=1 Tax=Shewanella oncorhynchi TaxID=2726434 RepID=UPI003D792FD2
MKTALNFLKLNIAIILGGVVIYLLVGVIFSYYQYSETFIAFLSGWWISSYTSWVFNKSGFKKK